MDDMTQNIEALASRVIYVTVDNKFAILISKRFFLKQMKKIMTIQGK